MYLAACTPNALRLLQVRSVGMNSHLVEVSGTLLVYPRRTILLPATLLLPESIPVRSTISIGVNGDLDTGLVSVHVLGGVLLQVKNAVLLLVSGGGRQGASCYVAG